MPVPSRMRGVETVDILNVPTRKSESLVARMCAMGKAYHIPSCYSMLKRSVPCTLWCGKQLGYTNGYYLVYGVMTFADER